MAPSNGKRHSGDSSGRTQTKKRSCAENDESPHVTSTKRARRSLNAASEARSPYFDQPETDEEIPPSSDDQESDFGSQESQSLTDAEDDQETSDASPVSGKGQRKIKSARTSAKSNATKGNELWREGAKVDLEPGTEVIIKRPKARGPGKTPYRDDTIHPNTLLFLRDLKSNNDRAWLKMHDPDFRASETDFKKFLDVVTERLVVIDETIPELPVKDIIFRIYRDIRFSPDPTPYKTHFSAAWSRTGRKGPYAAYYLQIAAGESFIGGGCWLPESTHLAALRNNIDRHPDRIRKVLAHKDMRREFLGNASEDDADIIKAFVSTRSNAESALKTKPKGYDADHRDIELLRLKSFTIGRRLSEAEVTNAKFIDRVAFLLGVMSPFITYLNSVVMPDGSDSEETSSTSEDGDLASQSGTDA